MIPAGLCCLPPGAYVDCLICADDCYLHTRGTLIFNFDILPLFRCTGIIDRYCAFQSLIADIGDTDGNFKGFQISKGIITDICYTLREHKIGQSGAAKCRVSYVGNTVGKCECSRVVTILEGIIIDSINAAIHG